MGLDRCSVSPLLLDLAGPVDDESADLEYRESLDLNYLVGSAVDLPYVTSAPGRALTKTLMRGEKGED